MNIGFLGLGKLGLPVSLAVEDKGHKVFGYDISEQTINDIKIKKLDIVRNGLINIYLIANLKLQILII